MQNESIKQLYHVYTIPVWVPYQNKNFRPSTTTGVISPRYDSHFYEILCCNHVTEKQEGTGMNLYQNENHAMYWCHWEVNRTDKSNKSCARGINTNSPNFQLNPFNCTSSFSTRFTSGIQHNLRLPCHCNGIHHITKGYKQQLKI